MGKPPWLSQVVLTEAWRADRRTRQATAPSCIPSWRETTIGEADDRSVAVSSPGKTFRTADVGYAGCKVLYSKRHGLSAHPPCPRQIKRLLAELERVRKESEAKDKVIKMKDKEIEVRSYLPCVPQTKPLMQPPCVVWLAGGCFTGDGVLHSCRATLLS